VSIVPGAAGGKRLIKTFQSGAFPHPAGPV